MRYAMLTLLIAAAFALTWNLQTCYDGRVLIYGYLNSESQPTVQVKIYNSTGDLVEVGTADFYSDYQDGRGVGFFVYETTLTPGKYLLSITTPEGSVLREFEYPIVTPTYSFKIVEVTENKIALYFDINNNVSVNLTVDGRYSDVTQTLNVTEDGYYFVSYSHARNEILVVSDGFCYDYRIFHDPIAYYNVEVIYPELSAEIGDTLDFTIDLVNKGDPVSLTLESNAELNVTSLHLDREEEATVRVTYQYDGSDIILEINPIGTYTIPVHEIAPELVVEEVVMPTAYKGGSVTGYVLVKNVGDKEATVRFKYRYDGKLYSDARERTILPGDEAEFYFTINVTDDTITFYIGDVEYTYTFAVYEKHRSFDVTLVKTPDIVEAGERAYAELRIENTGDYSDIYKISVSGVSYAYIQKNAISLMPGESSKVRIYVEPDENERVGFKVMEIEVCGLQECKDISVEFYVNQPEEKQTIVELPAKIEYYKEFSFTVNITNIGDTTKSYEVVCKELNQTWKFSLSPDESKLIEVYGNGSYDKLTFIVKVNGVEIKKEVELVAEGMPTGAFIGGAASVLWIIPIVAIVVALAYFYYFKK